MNNKIEIMEKSRIEFIKEAHQAACSEWRTKIEEEFPELFENENGWYKHIDGEYPKWLMYNDFDSDKGYGFGSTGEFSHWCENGYIKRHGLIPATHREVEEKLVEEAVRRGFTEGVYFKTAYTKVNRTGKGYIYFYRGTLKFSSSEETGLRPVILKNGVWATIIKAISKEEAEKLLGLTIKC